MEQDGAGSCTQRDEAPRAVWPWPGTQPRCRVPPFHPAPFLGWAVRSTVSVIPPVHPHLANSDPLFPGVSFLMELEIIWALLFLMCSRVGVTDGGSGVGLSSTCDPPATSTNVTAPQNHPAVKPCPQQLLNPQLNVRLFFFSKEKGPAGLRPCKGPFPTPKGGERWEARGSRQRKRGASQYSDGKCSEEGDWEKNNSNKHFMKQKMAYKEVNF